MPDTPEATVKPEQAARNTRRFRLTLFALAGLGAALGLAAVYGIVGFARNPTDAAQCRAAGEIAQRIAPLAQGEVAAVTVASAPLVVPDLKFTDAAGQPKSLADWRGRTVLFNLWATWCVPCRKEMPALEALQAKFGGEKFQVVAVNIDTRNPDKPKAWLKEVGIEGLAYYADPSAKVFQDLKVIGKAFGMPTTLLIDPAGCEIATLAGPAEWASGDAMRLIETALAK
jgi:thiol-disulfide isomerase/thioredoxin